MKKPRMHIFSYLAALVIGAILFAVLWRWMFGSGSSGVVIAGITGVLVAVIFFLWWNALRKPKDGR